jgi:Holliday junction resolvase
MAPLSRESLGRFLLDGSDTRETRLALAWLERELGAALTHENMHVVRAMAAVRAGTPPDAVARVLDWKEFEAFCASLLRAKGLEVTENLTMTKPRGQVDLLARTSRIALAVDCKHWARTMGKSALSRAAEAQARRADLLRRKMGRVEPMVVVMLVLSDVPTKYVNGAAVVPIYALGDFIDNVDSYTDGLPRH